MSLQIKCPCCKSVIHVNESFQGEKGKCPKCGQSLRIPVKTRQVTGKSLVEEAKFSNFSPEEMVKELSLRGKSAVLIVFDTPVEGVYKLHELDVSVSCVATDEMKASDIHQVLQSMGIISKKKISANSQDKLKNENSAKPYGFKGDILGTSLGDFKRKYYRKMEGATKTAPYCSDCKQSKEYEAMIRETFVKNPRMIASLLEEAEHCDANGMLLSEPWHAKAGIVSCRKEYPSELTSGERKPETIAGVETEVLVFRFVDEQLYQIVALFGTRDFETVADAMQEKYGEPDSTEKGPAKIYWCNGISSVFLGRGTINPQRCSHVSFTHDELFELAVARSPDPVEDL